MRSLCLRHAWPRSPVRLCGSEAGQRTSAVLSLAQSSCSTQVQERSCRTSRIIFAVKLVVGLPAQCVGHGSYKIFAYLLPQITISGYRGLGQLSA